MSHYEKPGFYNADCNLAMKEFPDKYFDLAIVDPPYGDGNSDIGGGKRFGERFDRYKKIDRTGRSWSKKYGREIVQWDVAPGPEYFEELFRVSKNQIIWGGNYFALPPTRCFLIWRKLTISESFSMAMCEYAWTSFHGNAKIFECPPQGKANDERFHPTQKPIALYSWILGNYAKPGDRILDTHVGSGSSLVACQRAGYEYWGFEIDPDYYEKAKARIDREAAQVTMWDALKAVEHG